MPALQVAAALRAEGASVDWIGGERAESELVPAAGIPFHPLPAEGISRTNPLRAARAVGKAGVALGRARRLLGALRADVVLGGGGYVAGPVGLAAVLRRVPLVLTEADSHLGLTNRALAPWARRVCLAFPVPGREGERYRVTGRPVPDPATDRGAARAALGLAESDRLVLVFGGSLGARSLNAAAPEAFAGASYRVLHITGPRDFATVTAPDDGYETRPYVADFGPVLLAADLVVARAGGSLWEVVAHGRPSILVPYPHATADHQTHNARWLERAGAAVLLPDAELTPARLRAEVDALLGDTGRLSAMGRAAAGFARPHAARDVAREVLAAAGPRRRPPIAPST